MEGHDWRHSNITCAEHCLNLVSSRLPVKISSWADRDFLGPGTHCFLFGLGKFRFTMHSGVRARRHPACRNETADGFRLVESLLFRIPLPLGEIQHVPAFAYVPRDPPGHWWNMAVPRPVRAIGVAVPASSH